MRLLAFNHYFLLATAFCASCDYSDDRVKIRNNSLHEIAVEFYRDTLPTINESNSEEYYVEVSIKPGETKHQFMVGNPKGWELFTERSANGRLNMAVFDLDSLRRYGMDSIIVLELYEMLSFSLTELEKRDWVILVE